MQKSIKKNAILNSVKQIMTIVFPLIIFPYVSRILSVENYGKINFSSSFVEYFYLIAALGIANYAVREGAYLRNNKQEFEIFANQVFTINLITTAISYGLLAMTLIFWTHISSYIMLIIIQSIGILFVALGADWINSIYEDYTYITVRYISMQLLSFIAIFLFVKNADDLYNYAWIIMISNVGANIMNIFYLKKYVKLKITGNINIKKHIVPMVILFANALAITIYVNSDVTLLGIFKGDTSVGIYSVAVKIYKIIKSLLNAVIIVTIPRLSAYLGQKYMDQYYDLLRKLLISLITIIVPAVVGLFMLSKEIIYIIAGKEYILGMSAMQWLCIALMFAILASYFSNAVLLTNKLEKYTLQATIFSAIINIVLNIFLIPKMDYNGAAITTVISEICVFIICFRQAKYFLHV